jgi:hypothetical protein
MTAAQNKNKNKAFVDDTAPPPPGYERARSRRLQKVVDDDDADDVPVVDVAVAAKAAKVVDAGPASVDHGKKAGAANALAFHSWQPSSSKSSKSSKNDR